MNNTLQEAISYLRNIFMAPEAIMDSSNVVDEESFKVELTSWIDEMQNDEDYVDYIDAYQEMLVYYKEAYAFFKAEANR